MARPAVLITGAAKRVGHAIALHFAREGHDVALHYHRAHTEAEQAAEEIRALGVECQLFAADLSDHMVYDGLIAQAQEAFPRLSVLVNNASVFDQGRFQESDHELYTREFRINTEAPIFLTQSFAKRVTRGAVVNMLDTKITDYKHSYFFYLLSKKTLAEFTKMAAVELGPDIRVNAVCPGHILPSEGWGENYQKRLEPMLPLKKIATLDAVVRSVYSLADNTSLTGQFLFVDGGESLI